jgi:cytochrome b561
MPEKKPVEKKPAWYDNYTTYIKDVIYIIGIVVSLYGWISTKAKNEATLETTIKYNTEAVKKLEDYMNKQVDLNGKQAEINGILMEFKNSHVR